jgi:hypothetical protein
MTATSLDSAIVEVERLRTNLRKGSNRQIRNADERTLMAATAKAWFNNHKPPLLRVSPKIDLARVDRLYQDLLEASDKNSARDGVTDGLKELKALLVSTRSALAIELSSAPPPAATSLPPNFSKVTSDPKMQAILTRRWTETDRCVAADAPLSATVMMGGLLEGLLLARINQLTDKSVVFKAASAPKDPKTGKSKPLQEWGLKNYIDVAHELGWISKPAKDIGEVLRDYRNFVHPQKEYSHDMIVTKADAELYWSIASLIARQLAPP